MRPGDPEPIEEKANVTYVPSRTAEAFHNDDSFYRGIMGPFRSGKSTACVQELLLRAHAQEPYHGVRRTRWAIIRSTYPELMSTTIRTWTSWVPETRCRIKYGAPIMGRLICPVWIDGRPDGTTVEMDVDFLALDRPDDKKKLLGTEYTGAWVNEAREIDEEIIEFLGRVGSFPYKHHGGATWSGVIMDTNPPHTRSWWYRKFELEQPPGWRLFKQPGAFVLDAAGNWVPNPLAENVDNLQQGYNYYLRMMAGKDIEWIKVYVGGLYGSTFEGLPVYQLYYNDAVHVAKNPLGFYRGIPLVAGMDFGLDPAFVVGQLTPAGALNILREFPGERTGLAQLLAEAVKPALAREFPGMQLNLAQGDPAGKSKYQGDITTPDCFEICRQLGIPAQPASTNDIVLRRQAVIDWLTRSINGRPAFQLDRSCVVLREGFLGGYHFARVQVNATDPRYKDVPEKNFYSHAHDALQYLCMGVGNPVRTPSKRAAPTGPGLEAWRAYR